MLDYLILNAKKYFEIDDNAEQIKANGKTWSSHPAAVTVRQGGVIGGANGSAISINRSTFKCVGMAKNCYAITGTANRYGHWDDLPDTFPIDLACVSASDIESANWGGKKKVLYLLLCQWLSVPSLDLRKEWKYARSHEA